MLDGLFSPAPLPTVGADHCVPRVLDGTRLVALTRLAFAGFDDIELERGREDLRRLDPRRCFGEGSQQFCIDEVKIAHLLNLAFGLALDPRRLPPVLAEHLGVDPLVSAASITETLATAEWQRDGHGGLVLNLDCPHEALDAALEAHVRDLGGHLHRLSRERVLPSVLLGRLPTRFSDCGVRPLQDGDGPRYRRPHLGFSLDQARVRELLMGDKLYGDPALALRELYQNALDACRYRRTRERWLRERRQLDRGTPDYRGLIVFRAGDDGGRAWIECEDNGIGMAERHLRGLFARAGRRFADSHEFHLEQADWDAAGIPFHPNSRFGIGVFSYFMLADELVVESRRMDPNGVDWEPGPLAEFGIGLPDLSVEVEQWLQDRDSPGKLKVLQDYIDWDGEYLGPLSLAHCCANYDMDPADFRPVLALLAPQDQPGLVGEEQLAGLWPIRHGARAGRGVGLACLGQCKGLRKNSLNKCRVI